MKNQGNMISQKEKDYSLATELKGMECCGLTDKEFEIGIMKKFSKLQENSKRHFNEIRNKINEQKECFNLRD